MTEADIGVVFCHDDKLTFRGQKHEVGLDSDWKAVMPRTGDVYRYGRERSPTEYDAKGRREWDYIEVVEWERLSDEDKREWFGLKNRSVTLAGDVVLFAGPAFVDIRMLNLWENFQTRYRASLDGLVGAVNRGVVAYAGKGEEGSREELEAVRNRFKRHWHAVEYEHDLIMPRDIGLALIEELRPFDMAGGKYEHGVYTKGWQVKDSKVVKVYDMMERHGQDAVKLEVTLRQDYLGRAGMFPPNAWEEQPDIQSRIRSTLEREWGIVFRKAKGAWAMLAEKVNVKQAELFSFMVDTKNTLTAVLAKQAEHDKRLAQHDRRIAALERGDRTLK